MVAMVIGSVAMDTMGVGSVAMGLLMMMLRIMMLLGLHVEFRGGIEATCVTFNC